MSRRGNIFISFLGSCCVSVADLRPRSSKVFGFVAVRMRGEEASAGEDAREPAVQAGFPRSQDFWRLPHFLTAFAVKL